MRPLFQRYVRRIKRERIPPRWSGAVTIDTDMPISRAARAAIGAKQSLKDGDDARAKVIAAFQRLEADNLAHWSVNDEGGLELHLHSGEIFQLHATYIVRLR